MIVYACTNTKNNKVYIGITSGDFISRQRAHKCDAFTRKKPNHFHRAIRKYGWECFRWEIIAYAKDYPDLLKQETYFIQKFNSTKNGYNMTEGGEGTIGYLHSEESKLKISEASKKTIRKPMPEETKKKIGSYRAGKKYEEIFGEKKSKEIKLKISQSGKDSYSGNEERKKILHKSYDEKYGERSSTIKKKMSESRKALLINGKREDLTEEGRKSIGDSKRGKKNPMFVEVTVEEKELILKLYNEKGKIDEIMLTTTGKSKYIIMKILKEEGIYNARGKN